MNLLTDYPLIRHNFNICRVPPPSGFVPKFQFISAFCSLVLALTLAVTFSVSVSAQTAISDSVRMELKMYQFHNKGGCGVGVVAVWPNVLQDLLGSGGQTYGYSNYGRVATDGMYIPGGYGEATTNPEMGVLIPDGYVGHNPQLGGGVFSLTGDGGPYDCTSAFSFVTWVLSGNWTLLNASPFRVTEWYATFNIPNGTVIPMFEWRPGDGLVIDFDASFESGRSRVVDAAAPGNKLPVASYVWDFGDGETGIGARPSHTYEEAGEYTVRLTVTDEDGNGATREEKVTVHAAHLTAEILTASIEVSQGDTLTVVARVTNSGTEPVFDVRAARMFTYVTRISDELNVEGGQVFYLDVKPVKLEEEEDGYVSYERLDPGESFEIERDYVVHKSAQYRNVRSDDPSFRPEDIFLDWTGVFPVVGETPEIGEVVVRQPCFDTEELCATTLIRRLGFITSIQEPDFEIAGRISLHQNYPNPFNPQTMIPYTLSVAGQVKIEVYDMLGRHVQTLVNATMPAGHHQISFDAGRLSSGAYIYRLEAGSELITKKMLLIE